ncbi:hypothetical protein ACQEU6_06575 [Spirillospora sp. CA-108201]
MGAKGVTVVPRVVNGSVFLAGIVCGIFAMLVIGVHAEERRVRRAGLAHSPAGGASRRLLSTQMGDDLPGRVTARGGVAPLWCWSDQKFSGRY